jgi:hypothetical protein
MPAIAKEPRLHACIRAPGAQIISPCICSLRVQGNEHMDRRAPLCRCCMLPIPLAAHRHKGEAPCPHAPRKRSHSGGLATKAQCVPSSHANVHALGAQGNLPSRWLTRRQGTRQGSPHTHKAQLRPYEQLTAPRYADAACY